MPPMTSICIIGLGYIGLPTAALMASRGFRVHGVDTDAAVRKAVAAGQAHVAEPDLAGLVRAVVDAGGLTTHAQPVAADAFLIAVPTPLTAEKRPMLGHVEDAIRAVAPVLAAGNVVILESTCPVGTTARMAALLASLRPGLRIPGDVAVAYCPERVLPGRILGELVQNDRVVGGLTPACAEAAAHLYERFVRGAIPRTAAGTAELVKLAENSFRDVNIAFANELSMVAHRHGVPVAELIALANRHPRVNILNPGPGVGGHCIAVDPWFVVDSAPEEARLIRTAREVNDHKAEWVAAQVEALARATPDAPITCFGLTFKADVDDLRESPALAITQGLQRAFPGRVAAVEPHVTAVPGLTLLPLVAALERVGIFVLLVDHTAFRRVPRARLQGRHVVDTRGVWS